MNGILNGISSEGLGDFGHLSDISDKCTIYAIRGVAHKWLNWLINGSYMAHNGLSILREEQRREE